MIFPLSHRERGNGGGEAGKSYWTRFIKLTAMPHTHKIGGLSN